MSWVVRFVSLILLTLLVGCSDKQEEPQPIVEESKPIIDYTQMPKRCREYVNKFIDSENPSRFMAQMEQESSCNLFAESPFAKGLMQFTDSTGEWLSTTHCKRLGPFDPFNAHWSIECGKIYMALLESNNDYGSYCFDKKVAEAEYNGGAWIVWELNYTGNTSFEAAKNVCGKVKLNNGRKRAAWACKENYSYADHISKRQLKYTSITGTVCD